MRFNRTAVAVSIVIVVFAVAAVIAGAQLPAVGAGALLFPSRHLTALPAPVNCVNQQFDGVGVQLTGWYCASTGAERKGTIVYLHGVADNRGSAISAIEIFVPRGFDVVAYDSRAHGASTGDRCTYGYFEKRDLQKVLDQVGATDVILIGASLGAAVALQTAAIEPRVTAVVAVSTFSDLRTVASERVSVLPAWSLGPAFTRAERDGQFVLDEVSPVLAAEKISIPVLLVHGANDRETLPAHSERVLRALRGPKQLITVAGAGHNDVLRGEVWSQIEKWVSLWQSPSLENPHEPR